MDRSLDDIIPSGRRRGAGFRRGGPQRRRGGFGGGGSAFEHDDRGGAFGQDNRSGGGVVRRNRVVRRNNTPYSRSVGSVDTVWKHDLYQEEEEEEDGFEDGTLDNNGPRTGIETGTRLQITNLAYSVLSEDLKDLFESVGDIKRATVNFDKSGRSLGTATVVFSRRSDAVNALKKYNNVPLDESPMKITLVGTNVGVNGGRQVNNNNTLRAAVDEAFTISVGAPRTRRIVAQGVGRVRRLTTGRRPAGRVSGGGRGRRGGFGRKKTPTAEELDAEMDAYNQEGNE